ncbi:hypothetical protein ABFS82_03G090100 [Erythranthe guttata]|uniref:Auxin efflux carrier component n=1 Tax=Erythranthe guttata TaxID=4155 RepID=A0A022PRH1_ERYGU|nr:PREDICTED: probable auxin efflux carrier component 6 [Erythranthe guttata]EYU17408.1 hypothetical protein MIMGU_mgv1a004829mg [Erythranthe guttata]|eukprot:XP_012829533.1 PREDICTED: probable auxin efflux carrier component 6 [Erythranthe guttata]
MISTNDFYNVMCSMVPLYFAMLVAYASVKWWGIFSPEQCSGINRFVAVFAVPVLSFHFISQNNPYQMDTKFILADTLSKSLVLVSLSIWCVCKGQIDWLITLFSVSTLPNTLVMGIPLLKAMYGDFTTSLMVQLVVLQCIIWYTLLLFLFEYRAAAILIQTQFPGQAAAAITKFEIDNDVISLDGRDPLLTESEVDDNGRIHVRIRRSTSSAATSVGPTPRGSNLSNAEIFSIGTPLEYGFGFRPVSPAGFSAGYASSDAYSLQPTPRASSFNELDSAAASPVAGKIFRQPSPVVKMVWESPEEGHGFGDVAEKDLSFRDCGRISVEEGLDMKETSTNQEMPRALVMLRLILIMVGRKLLRNPNTYSSVLGLSWSLISFKWNVGMPSLVKYSVKIISDAGLGMAMFSLGLFMALQPRLIACGTKMATISMLIRFIGGPILMCAASFAVGLRGAHLHAAIVQAALPQGIVPFVFAREYGLHPDILSTGVIFGMLVSLPVTLMYYILLGL